MWGTPSDFHGKEPQKRKISFLCFLQTIVFWGYLCQSAVYLAVFCLYLPSCWAFHWFWRSPRCVVFSRGIPLCHDGKASGASNRRLDFSVLGARGGGGARVVLGQLPGVAGALRPETSAAAVLSFHLVKNICLFSPVGFKGNRFQYWTYFYFILQMEVSQRPKGGGMDGWRPGALVFLGVEGSRNPPFLWW